MTVPDYVTLIREAHESQGSLTGQRDVLTTTTAKRIRTRMVADLNLGAVLPPVVIGAVVPADLFGKLPMEDASAVAEFLPEGTIKTLSIIDGMQRTAAMLEALEISDALKSRSIRVEFWIASNVRSMIYRMLVLNTGQVPWTISRQLSVIYAPLIEEIVGRVSGVERVFTPDSPGRRVDAGQYSSSHLVELYIAFSLRKTSVDTREAVSDEFSRLDFVENLSEPEFQEQFYSAMGILAALDRAFTRFDAGSGQRYSRGKDVFGAQPARIGLIVAIGAYVLGRPGADTSADDRGRRLARVQSWSDTLLARLNELDDEQLGEFLKLDVLAETLDRRVGQVGRYERSVFYEAFKALIEDQFEVPSMEPCWRAN
ncbi:hypothetical protein GCM10011589_19460 [Modestobacter marinus]|uniref:DUF262 domain-containing protein n=1 Tax=Modestobacter marinus TaxID=477641 RepID=A0ABQ2FXF4_9ACTN|nr:hypothetical protein GCM10011589_19460 [Modestobacter marinus]